MPEAALEAALADLAGQLRYQRRQLTEIIRRLATIETAVHPTTTEDPMSDETTTDETEGDAAEVVEETPEAEGADETGGDAED
jgi:hypothetical protein